MFRSSFLLLAGGAFLLGGFAIPTDPYQWEERQIAADQASGLAEAEATATVKHFDAIQPSRRPTSVPQIQSILSNVYGREPVASKERIERLVEQGFTPGNLTEVYTTYSRGVHSHTNKNDKDPPFPVYPEKSPKDAPYSMRERDLRSAIQIPESFSHGLVRPLVMVPGTGSTGFLTFGPNFIKQFTGSPFADPVWLNIPDFLLNDAQENAEYVAYAINYISAISRGTNVSVIAWSQGNLDTQWALKYWPSTRSVVSDFVSISPDFHGTKEAYLLCTILKLAACPPAVNQQEWSSKFVKTLRGDGGDSAYVPTTTVYSKTDEVVQPQSGPDASAIILDERRVGVSNSLLQEVCSDDLIATHEGMLCNGLAYALAVDALTHPGPGDVRRLDLRSVCAQEVSPGLGPEDVLATEENIVVALSAVLLYFPKRLLEPRIRDYARNCRFLC